jgi:pimeloyl-ACP methyl ester carboxylesterase
MSELAARLEKFQREHPKRSLSVGSTEWTYRLAGSGAEGLVVLPGALGGSEGMAPLLQHFTDDYRLLFVEYPVVSGLDDVLAGLFEILKREGIGRTALLGGSFGGMVAQAFLLRFPEKTSRVVLSATGPPDPRRARTNERFLRLFRFIPMGLVRSLLRLGIKKLMRRVPRDRELWLRFYSKALDGLTRGRLQALYRVSIDFDREYSGRSAALESWPGEMLLIEGSEDRVASNKSRDALKAAYRRAETVTLRGAGHGMSLERPEEWRDAVTRFLKRSWNLEPS